MRAVKTVAQTAVATIGTAADWRMTVSASVLAVAQYAELLQPTAGGIGVYGAFIHVDVRAVMTR